MRVEVEERAVKHLCVQALKLVEYKRHLALLLGA